MNLFEDIAPKNEQHPIYQLIKADEYAPERAVLQSWAEGFEDRDNKFVFEFQTSFEPCLWELYLHACLKEMNLTSDFSKSSPDFWVKSEKEFCIEATVAAPPAGGQPPHSFSIDHGPKDFNKFNADSALRICNSFSSKEKKYKKSYSKYDHVKNKPFVVAIASYDRPFSHMAANRPIFAAVYGLYYDEEFTIENNLADVCRYNVDSVKKNDKTDIPVGFFLDESYSHVSAVIYSALATWGKVRALANNPDANSVYVSFHPNENDIKPIVKQSLKRDYAEDLLDGLYILHNPSADHPLDRSTFSHTRIAQVFPDKNGELEVVMPDDFLLMRFLLSLKFAESEEVESA
jgi:hypothetical protein